MKKLVIKITLILSLLSCVGGWVALDSLNHPLELLSLTHDGVLSDPTSRPHVLKATTSEQIVRLAPAANSARALLATLGSEASWTQIDFAESAARTTLRPYSVSVDWSVPRCIAQIDQSLAFGGSAPELGARLGLASAVAGCALRARPHLAWRDAGFKGPAPEGLLDELWLSEVTMADEERTHWFRVGSKGYAEAAAAGSALVDGVAPSAIEQAFSDVSSAAFAAEQDYDPSGSTAWVTKGSWRSKGWSVERASRAAGARWVLGQNGFAIIAALPPSEIAYIVATSWCQWLRAEEASELAIEGSHPLLGTIHQDAAHRRAAVAEQMHRTGKSSGAFLQPSSADWGVPFPDLTMPRFAVNKLQWNPSPRMAQGEKLLDISPSEEHVCIDSGVALLAARYGIHVVGPR